MQWLRWIALIVILIFSVSTCQAQVKVNVKDHGAVGDGVTNDTAAFQVASQVLQTRGGGTLYIPPGTYVVGEQFHVPAQYPYYQNKTIVRLDNVKRLTIEGNNATLKVPAGLRYGSFDKDTGAVYNPPAMPFVDRDYVAGVGFLFFITNSRHVTIRNLELDGSNAGLILGGQWGDTGRQVQAGGITLYNNRDVRIENVHSHHHGQDGIIVGWTGLTAADAPTMHTIVNVNCEYNGRQGLSWVGGRGMRVYRSKFNHTGRGAVASAPLAGVDIEAEESVCRDGYFEDCEFINNLGQGMVSDSGDGGHTRFVRCTFWGTSNWSVWSNKPGLKYTDCNFYGSAVHVVGSPDPNLATGFLRCNFEDKPWTNGQVYRGNFLMDSDAGGDNVTFDSCNFTAHQTRSVWMGTSTNTEYFKNCTFTHEYTGLPDGLFQAMFRGGNFQDCRFKENFAPGTTQNWYIVTQNVNVVAGTTGTIVDGPRIRWMAPNTGLTGTIPPGVYNF